MGRVQVGDTLQQVPTSSGRDGSSVYSRRFNFARVTIFADRRWRLRAPVSPVRKGPIDGKERTRSGAVLESGAGTETVTGSGVGTGT